MLKKILLLLSLTFSAGAFALSEANYDQDYQEQIIPLINSFKYGAMKGEKTIFIHYATYTTNPDSTQCLVILPGRSEPLEKYAEVVHSLNTGATANTYKFFLMDHRGQGTSSRMDQVQSDMGYVDQFENYTKDLKTFLDTVVIPSGCSQKYLLAHSLGAGIAVSFMQEHPEYFDKAALSSPMLKIMTAPYSYKLARSIVLANMAAGRGKKFAVGQSGFTGIRNFEANTFTTSKVRYDMAMNMFDMNPKAKLGGVSNRWLNEVMKATKDIRKNYHELVIPLRVFHAGMESYSEKGEMIRLCNEAAYCKRTYLENSKHEVLMDSDANRDVVIAGLVEFFN